MTSLKPWRIPREPKPRPPWTKAEDAAFEAVRHVLNVMQRDVNLFAQLEGTRAFDLLCAAEAALRGEKEEQTRALRVRFRGPAGALSRIAAFQVLEDGAFNAAHDLMEGKDVLAGSAHAEQLVAAFKKVRGLP